MEGRAARESALLDTEHATAASVRDAAQGGVAAAAPDRAALRLFGHGFLSLLPLWSGAIPFGIAYGVAARGAGLDPTATQLMSLVVFSAAAQVSAVSLIEAGAPLVVLLATALALNAQLLLLGLSVGRQSRLSWPGRLVVAWFLTDGAYGVTFARGLASVPALVGAGVSMYVGWNLGTALGVGIGSALPDPRTAGIDVIVPLTFLAVLVPIVRTRPALLVALVAGIATLVLGRFVPNGLAVLGGGLLACAAGAWMTRERSRPGPVGPRPTVTEGGV